MPDTQPGKVACPTCGAPLVFGAGEITTRCTFCHAVVERPLQADQPPVLKSAPTRLSRSSWAPAPSADKPVAFIRLALFLGMAAVLGVVVLTAVLIRNKDRYSMLFNGSIVPYPVDRSEGPDFIALAYQIDPSQYRYVRIDPVAGRMVWSGKEFEDSSAVRTLAAGDGLFFAVEGTELHAYQAADGADAWTAELTDQLDYCGECLSVAGNRVIALTRDYVIQAFDSGTGAPAWSRRMDGYTKGFTVADGGLWVIDKMSGEFSLLRLDLADGSVTRIIAPSCLRADGAVEYELSATSWFAFDPDPAIPSPARSVYFLYGSSPSCVERWDASSAVRIWQTADEQGYSPSQDFAALFTPEVLYFAYKDRLWSAEAGTGQVRLLSEGGDYDLVPIALEENVLVLRTKRTRGTTRFGLRGFDPDAAVILWDHPLENTEPYDPPDAAFPHVEKDLSIWAWRLSGGLLHLYMFQADPNQVSLPTLNPADGSFSAGAAIPLNFASDSYFGPEILGWSDPLLWMVADSRLMGIDVSAAKIRYRFP